MGGHHSRHVVQGIGAGSGQVAEVALPHGTGAPEVAVGDDVVLIRTSSPEG